jgi:hypothetical protein
VADYPKGTRKIDAALTDMRNQLDWLRSKRSPSGHAWFETDLAREVGFTEAMDMLARYGAKIVDPESAEVQS